MSERKMSTRFKSNSQSKFNQSPLPTGYENTAGVPDLVVPSCGTEDIDVALFKLFDSEINPQYGGIDSAPMKKVPVIFAAGEKWALLKRGKLLRDKTNTLVLPLITIMRTELNQSISEDVTGRGINQQVGEIVIRRRLDRTDRNYQALINRLLLPNQDGVSSPSESGSPNTDRTKGGLSTFASKGAHLVPNRLNNVYETIVVPTPQFYTAKYQVTVWTQYTQHANQIMEKVFSSFLPQGQAWRLDTPKGYWFVAKVEEGSFAIETNFDDMSQQERYIKHTFNVSVPAYYFANTAPGAPVPIKRYVSSPTVNFETGFADVNDDPADEGMYTLGSDDPTLPLDLQKNNRDDQRTIGWRMQKIYPVVPSVESSVEDPAIEATPRGETVKVVTLNSKGETVYRGVQLGGLEIVVTK